MFDDGLAHINGTLEYLNPRGLEGVAGLGLHALTGEDKYKQRAEQCLEAIMARQYPCGAQPYHTGGWVWGRKPAQAYQMLTATMMVRMAHQLDRPDVIEYVRRLLAFVQLTTTRRGEVLITPFEGLHKSNSRAAASWAWPVSASVGLNGLSHATYRYWYEHIAPLLETTPDDTDPVAQRPYSNALFNAAMLGVQALPQDEPFAPKLGAHALPDISTIVVHERDTDVVATLLTGYSAFAQGEVGDVRLFAVTPELTDQPTFRNAGTDPLREDWTKSSEQIACQSDGRRAEVRGRVYTKWDIPEGEQAGSRPDLRRVHARELEVMMSWEAGELLLDYRTTRNNHVEPVSSRMLFLLGMQSNDASPQLRIGQSLDQALPAAAAQASYKFEAEPGPVRFEGPDGAAIEIVPERGQMERVVVERPEQKVVPRQKP